LHIIAIKKVTNKRELLPALLVFSIPKGTSKNLAPLVFRVPNFIFYLKEGVLSMSYILFFATPSDFLPIGFLEVPKHTPLSCATY
jgi:hypothetical protein